MMLDNRKAKVMIVAGVFVAGCARPAGCSVPRSVVPTVTVIRSWNVRLTCWRSPAAAQTRAAVRCNALFGATLERFMAVIPAPV